jgi:ketosteroid isomerase-like protein
MATIDEQSIQRDTGTVAATIQQYVDAFNAGDEDALAACFTEKGFILDGMAPHVWSGPSATRDWHKDALAESEHLGITDFHMTLGTPSHNATVGNAGYFVAPATLNFKMRGQAITQAGATFTVALHKGEAGWRIAAWAWTKGAGGGVDDGRPASA